MPSASQLKPEDRFVGLFVGPSGSGKKVAACSFPHPIKYFDFDGRIRGILGAKWIEKSGIDYEYYPPRTKVGTTNYAKLNTDFEVLENTCIMGSCQYKTIVLSSLTGLTFDLLCDAIPQTHAGAKGKKLGTMNMPGPEDYGFEANGTYQIMAFLRSLPIPNIIVTAHVIDRYGKADPSDTYSERVVVGEKVSLRDKIAANIPTYFDHIFKFDSRMQGIEKHFTCEFRGDMARTSYEALPNGTVDITGVDFYKKIMEKVAAPIGVTS